MESRSDLFGERIRTYTKTKVSKLLLPLSATVDNGVFDHFLHTETLKGTTDERKRRWKH